MSDFNSPKEINEHLKSLSVLEYAAAEEKNFERNLANNTDYKRKTTFFYDLSIAERSGIAAVNETYNRVMKEWLDDIEYITEFALSLNYKSWEWNGREDDEMTDLYIDLFYKSQDAIYEHFDDNKEALKYYYEITD